MEKTAAVSRDPRTAAAATVIVRGARFFSELALMDFSAWHSAEIEFNFSQVHEIERKAMLEKQQRALHRLIDDRP